MALAVSATREVRASPASRSSDRMARAASIPSITGIWMSISTTSQRPVRKASSAWAPSPVIVTSQPSWDSKVRSTSWFTGWSSAARMRRPSPASSRPATSAGTSAPPTSGLSPIRGRGRSAMNTVPSPGALETVISPPKAWTSSRQMDRPRPVPPYLRVVEASACSNLEKILAACSAVMPMPVSRTLRRRPSPAPIAAKVTNTPPSPVNLMALETRLSTICRRRVGSPR